MFFVTAYKIEIDNFLITFLLVNYRGKIKLNGLIKNVANVAL